MTSVSESRGVRRTASGYCRRFSQAVVTACSVGDDIRNRGGQRFTGVGRSPVQAPKGARGQLNFMDDSASMCPELEPHTAAPHPPLTGCKRPPPACTQETDTAFMSDSGDESVTSSCGSSASFGSVPRSFSFSAPTNSPSSDEGTSKQASASSLVSPILLQSQGFQKGWLRELEAMGVPTTDNLDEALQSEGRLAYMPPRKKRPTPPASSVAFLSSPHAEASLQGGSSHDTGFTSMQPAATLRLPAPVFSQTLPAQIRSPLFGCDCPICTGIAMAKPPAGAGDKLLQGAITQRAHIPSSWGIAAALASGNLSPPDRLEPQTPPRASMLPNTAQASFASAQDMGLSV